MKNPFKAIFTAWLLAGTLDIIAAIINYLIYFRENLIGLFQFIAGGVFGIKAFSGGILTALSGLIFHHFIAFSWTIFFFFVCPKVKILSRNNYISGLVYGIFIWLIMNLVVLKLSNVPNISFSITHTVVGIVILMFCVGLPIFLIIGKYYTPEMMEQTKA